jgi:hypothetical protein
MIKALDRWLPAYLRRPHRLASTGVTDIMLAVCDHFEPLHNADKPTAFERLHRWQREFPPLIEPFRDADGIRPRHTFFYPVEQYDPDLVGELTKLCKSCGGEVELHLHHDRDTDAGLRAKLEKGKSDLARHNLLARDSAGNLRYGFIHGNWALDDSHPQRRYCGVPNELATLHDTGCYADFTMPSAPDPTQTRTINSIYYATEDGRPKSHDIGKPARVRDGVGRVTPYAPSEAQAQLSGAHGVSRPTDNSLTSVPSHLTPDLPHLLLVQGPLGLNWERRKFGLLPRIENGAITGANPPRPDRLRLWLRLGIHVLGQPNWLFIKLYTHGGIPQNMVTLLADPMRRFFEHALAAYNDGTNYRLHFVTAREMVNIIHAAEDGEVGNAGRFRDYRYISALKHSPAATR